MYDLDDDDIISRTELLAVLHMMVGSNISEDQVSMLLQIHCNAGGYHYILHIFRKPFKKPLKNYKASELVMLEKNAKIHIFPYRGLSPTLGATVTCHTFLESSLIDL